MIQEKADYVVNIGPAIFHIQSHELSLIYEPQDWSYRIVRPIRHSFKLEISESIFLGLCKQQGQSVAALIASIVGSNPRWQVKELGIALEPDSAYISYTSQQEMPSIFCKKRFKSSTVVFAGTFSNLQ